MKKKQPRLLRPKSTGPSNVNQHAPVFLHRATKRNRAKDVKKRKAIQDAFQLPA